MLFLTLLWPGPVAPNGILMACWLWMTLALPDSVCHTTLGLPLQAGYYGYELSEPAVEAAAAVGERAQVRKLEAAACRRGA